MTITERLIESFQDDTLFIGQIGILKIIKSDTPHFILSHLDDWGNVTKGEYDLLKNYDDPRQAREISLYNKDGEYRFTKGQLDLINGWVMHLKGADTLQQALDIFYPAALGLHHSHKNGTLRTQNLRDKLNRQTGMYRYAHTISNDGAQNLVQSLCGPGNNCVKKILWKIDDQNTLSDSEASRFDGILTKENDKAIPLVCQEACNFFVSKCRIQAKKESEKNTTKH